MSVSAKAASSLDRHVGQRVRLRRMLIGMSQEKLGAALGVTFQQIQKYEKGKNRIGASRLHEVAAALAVPISFLFEGSPEQPCPAAVSKVEDTVDFSTLLTTREAFRLARAFAQIGDAEVRQSLLRLVESLAEVGDDAAPIANKPPAPSETRP